MNSGLNPYVCPATSGPDFTMGTVPILEGGGNYVDVQMSWPYTDCVPLLRFRYISFSVVRVEGAQPLPVVELPPSSGHVLETYPDGKYILRIAGDVSSVDLRARSGGDDFAYRTEGKFNLQVTSAQCYHMTPSVVIFSTFHGCGTFGVMTVQDNDDWTVTATTPDTIALEPCTWITGPERKGEFLLKKSNPSQTPDNRYDLMVDFELQGTATPGSSGSSGDYHLTKNINGGVAADVISVTNVNGVWKGTATIKAGVSSLTLYVMPNGDTIFEPDETAKLVITKVYNGSNIYRHFNAATNVTILQAPEFISDADTDPLPQRVPINADYWNLPKKYERTTKDTVIIDALPCVKNRPVKYSIVEGNDIGLYKIDEQTGEITFARDYEPGVGSHTLKVRVADKQYPNLYDEATVSFSYTMLAKFGLFARSGSATVQEIIAAGGVNVDGGHSFWGLEIPNLHDFVDIATSDPNANMSSQELWILLHKYGYDIRNVNGHLVTVTTVFWGYYANMSNGGSVILGVPGTMQVENNINFTQSHEKLLWDAQTILSLLQYTDNLFANPGIYTLMFNNCNTKAREAAELVGMHIDCLVTAEPCWVPQHLAEDITAHELTCSYCM